jgi:hypothetical protein
MQAWNLFPSLVVLYRESWQTSSELEVLDSDGSPSVQRDVQEERGLTRREIEVGRASKLRNRNLMSSGWRGRNVLMVGP